MAKIPGPKKAKLSNIYTDIHNTVKSYGFLFHSLIVSRFLSVFLGEIQAQ
jgi:hypothetical protein